MVSIEKSSLIQKVNLVLGILNILGSLFLFLFALKVANYISINLMLLTITWIVFTQWIGQNLINEFLRENEKVL